MNVVLVEPEIPPNTGNVARLCAATRSTLHLVGPLGFKLTDKELKRAGMDYWEQVTWRYWESWEELREAAQSGSGTPQSKAARGQPNDVIPSAARTLCNPVAEELRDSSQARNDKSDVFRPPSWHYATTKSTRLYTSVRYRWGDYLVFGRETAGLSEELREANQDRTITIPMLNPQARSLNLATAVAIVLYEAVRQVRGL